MINLASLLQDIVYSTLIAISSLYGHTSRVIVSELPV